MGDCPSSGVLRFEEHERPLLPCELTVEFWDRDYPHDGDDPRINITAEDRHLASITTAGLNVEQVRELRDGLTHFLENNPPASREEDADA